MKRLALLPLLVLPLAACGGGTTSPKDWQNPTYAAASKAGGLYENANQLRKAIASLGIDCVDSSWTPEDQPSETYADTEGECKNGMRVAVAQDPASAKQLADSIANNIPRGTRIVKGPNWVATTKDQDASSAIVASLGGAYYTPS